MWSLSTADNIVAIIAGEIPICALSGGSCLRINPQSSLAAAACRGEPNPSSCPRFQALSQAQDQVGPGPALPFPALVADGCSYIELPCPVQTRSTSGVQADAWLPSAVCEMCLACSTIALTCQRDLQAAIQQKDSEKFGARAIGSVVFNTFVFMQVLPCLALCRGLT